MTDSTLSSHSLSSYSRSDLITDRTMWIAVALISIAAFWLKDDLSWLDGDIDPAKQLVAGAINTLIDVLIQYFGWFFQAISWLFSWPLGGLQAALHWLPWSVTLVLFSLIAYQAGGLSLALFTAVGLFYMVVTGYWSQSMNTLVLVGIAAPVAAGIGFGLGVLAYQSPRAAAIIRPCLDLAQTVPTFAYLVPLLLLFGFGPVVGLVASAIYACPPMVRNVFHGLSQVPESLVEAGEMSGATTRQMFWWIKVPTALPQIMVGVNQAIMATLSMVIIAAIIGGFDDIGWEVLSTMRKAQFGQSLLAGIVIALIAMLLDRISYGFASGNAPNQPVITHTVRAGLIALLVVAAIAFFWGPFQDWPKAWRIYPAAQLNEGLNYVVVRFGDLFDAIKNGLNYYFMLPIRVGLWTLLTLVGTAVTLPMKIAYWVITLFLMVLALRAGSLNGAVGIALLATMLSFGLTQIPWPAYFMVIALLSWQIGGTPFVAFAVAGMSFILLTGYWEPAILSLYLAGAAVAFSFVVGGGLGILAAKNDALSALLRPINDSLQTMPQFVYLIPVIFLFGAGDLPALIAIIGYSIVPMVRYTEHALRGVSPQVMEAAESIGCTGWQKLIFVELPMAWPGILLGINQTIMYALAMLVIAALVGTRDLGQSVYIALTEADAGAALTAGLSIAFMAMIADSLIRATASSRKGQLGL